MVIKLNSADTAKWLTESASGSVVRPFQDAVHKAAGLMAVASGAQVKVFADRELFADSDGNHGTSVLSVVEPE